MSGWPATIWTKPRREVSVAAAGLLIFTATVPKPVAAATGTTKLICFSALPTKYRPAAPPLTLSDTPFSSIGKAGLRFVSDAPPVYAAVPRARLTVDRAIDSSPGAKPTAVPGEGLGVGVGVGVGLGRGVAVTT